MLEKPQFETPTGGGQPEICRIDLDDRGPPDVGADQPLSLGDIVSIDDALSPGIHISTRHNGCLICTRMSTAAMHAPDLCAVPKGDLEHAANSVNTDAGS